MKSNAWILTIILYAGSLFGQNNIDRSRQTAITNAIKIVSPTVASINVVQLKEVAGRSAFNDPFLQYFFPYELQRQRVKSSGSGVVISPDGYIITNHHVIENASEILVTLPGGSEFRGEFIGVDKITDLALIKLSGQDFPSATLGNSDEIIIGEWVVALGNPFGLFDVNFQPTATAGIISAINMDFGRQQSGQLFQDMIQTDASINPGNSGGPLVNSLGEVIGINTFIFSGSEGSIGIGFAIPINRVKEIAEELKTYGRIDRNFSTGLHVQPLNSSLANLLEIPYSSGVIIVEVDKGSAAEKAGLLPADVILSVNNVKIKNSKEIFNIIESNDIRPGDKVKLDIYRDGNNKKISLILGSI